jgi:Cysteine-rich secretory protein family
MLIPRRSFLVAAIPGLTLGARAMLSAQILIERGRFGAENLPLVRDELLRLINSERAAAGLEALRLDDLASEVANAHALDMANSNFLSHWGSDGRKPYHRYSFAGGIDAVQENVSRANDIASVTPNGVSADLRDMHVKMFDEIPPNDGHRRAMLAPQNTHAGFGIVLNGHNLKLVELYLARYVTVDPVPQHAKRKASITIAGKLLDAKHFLQQVDIHFEPLPTAPDFDWLRTPRPYALPDEHVSLRPKLPEGIFYSDRTTGDFDWGYGKFRVPVKLYKDEPGIYTIVLWVRRVPAEKAFPVTGICIRGE